jgi:hypothetical protein
MNKAQGKSARTSGPRNKAKKNVRKIKDAAELRQQIETLVKREAMHLVGSAIAEADKGHFAAMKYLFEMIGLYPGTNEAEPEGEASLARTLLRRLGMPEDPLSEAAPAAMTAAMAQTGDIIE